MNYDKIRSILKQGFNYYSCKELAELINPTLKCSYDKYSIGLLRDKLWHNYTTTCISEWVEVNTAVDVTNDPPTVLGTKLISKPILLTTKMIDAGKEPVGYSKWVVNNNYKPRLQTNSDSQMWLDKCFEHQKLLKQVYFDGWSGLSNLYHNSEIDELYHNDSGDYWELKVQEKHTIRWIKIVTLHDFMVATKSPMNDNLLKQITG